MKSRLTVLSMALLCPAVMFSQEMTQTTSAQSETTSVDSNPSYNSWSISFGGGIPLMQNADLKSIQDGNTLVGYSSYFSIDKALSHTFGLKLQYDRGETRQGYFNTKDAAPANAAANLQVAGRTQYDAISLLGDINLSNLLRRVDRNSDYRWAIHGYAGAGVLAYRAYQKDEFGQRMMTEKKPFKFNSLFGQAGAGLKYKISNRMDIEGRLMYVVSGDEEFDGGGDQYSAVNRISSHTSDNFFNATLGLTVNLGKNTNHVMWVDPLKDIYKNMSELEAKVDNIQLCKSGDADNDGVCDDWDRQLDTPAGARVDGAGVALDVDMDGVIDLNDKCVTVPGPVENNGCPIGNSNNGGVASADETLMNGIEFDLNSDRILPSNTPILNSAVSYINSTNGSYVVVGATDSRGSASYNKALSQKRANNVKQYLISNGANSSKLETMGNGKFDLKYPECDPASKCPEWKNKANRRVYFKAK